MDVRGQPLLRFDGGEVLHVRNRGPRRVTLWLTGLITALAAASCGAGGGSSTVTASYAGQTYRDSAGSDVALAVMAERLRLRKHRQPERRFDSMVMVIQGMSGRRAEGCRQHVVD
jgi:hypothetical protein